MNKNHFSGTMLMAALICCAQIKTFEQTDWHITGNSTNATTNFVGTTDNQNKKENLSFSATFSMGYKTQEVSVL